jgi:hypothetical protein
VKVTLPQRRGTTRSCPFTLRTEDSYRLHSSLTLIATNPTAEKSLKALRVSGFRERVLRESRQEGRRPPRPSQVGVFRRECAMRILKPFTSNIRLVTLCSRCHHSEFLHSDPTGGPCLFCECTCPRFAPKPPAEGLQEADSELSS